MKKLFILSLLFISNINLYSQLYRPGGSVRGKNVEYICSDFGMDDLKFVFVYNSKFTDLTDQIYDIDGKPVFDYYFLGDYPYKNDFDIKHLRREVYKSFSLKEFEELRSAKSKLIVRITSDNKGKPSEVIFLLIKDAPILINLDPDRLYEIEKKIFSIYKLELYGRTKRLKNMKMIVYLPFYERN